MTPGFEGLGSSKGDQDEAVCNDRAFRFDGVAPGKIELVHVLVSMHTICPYMQHALPLLSYGERNENELILQAPSC